MFPNGFIPLAQYDFLLAGGNDDGMITPHDAIWSSLLLWFDANADGISQQGELLPIDDSGLHTLSTIPKESGRSDRYKNQLRYWAHAWGSARAPIKLYDVFFRETSP